MQDIREPPTYDPISLTLNNIYAFDVTIRSFSCVSSSDSTNYEFLIRTLAPVTAFVDDSKILTASNSTMLYSTGGVYTDFIFI